MDKISERPKKGANRRLEALVRQESQNSLTSVGHSNSGTSNSSHQAVFQPWTDKYKPVTLETHFVHKKKVEDIGNWLSFKTAKVQPSICVLTGPSGSGKTATISLLAGQKGIAVKEWINPMNLTEFNPHLEFNRDEVQGRNQLDSFSDFLLRSSQYSALPLKGVARGSGKKLILIEDFPNTFYRQPTLFHHLLRNYAKIGCCPLVFIMADAASGEGNVNKLFPQALLAELGIQQFAFNPIAPSYIVKHLGTIVSRESLDAENGLLEDIAVASSGDIRWAVNHFQFKMQQIKQPFFKKPAPRPKRGAKGSKESKVPKFDEKDETLFLFRALGKVLYSKRDTTVDSPVESELRGPLTALTRNHPLIEIPETIGDKMEVSPETFFHFLHHNHPSFFSNIEDLAQASTFLADSALIFSQWIVDDSSGRNFKNRDTREELGLSIAIRGLMHSNSERVASTWKPLRKPMMSEVNAAIQKTTETSRFLFSTDSPLTQGFYPEVLPFYARLLPRNFRPDQLGFLKDRKLGNKFGQAKDFGSALLNEKDAVEEECEVENEPPEKMVKESKGPKSNSNSKSAKNIPIPTPVVNRTDESEEEEFEIEDYDDEFII